MPEETPNFSTKPIKKTAKTKKKVVRRKKTASVKKSDTKKTAQPKKKLVRKRKPVTKKTTTKLPKEEINEQMDKQLSDIYQDNSGKIPNMKRIKVKKTHPVIKFFFSLIVVGGLLAAIAWAGFFVLPNNQGFSEDKVRLEIQGTKKITLGATSTYVISYNNNQATKLENAVLTIQYPKGFMFKESSPNASNSGHTEWQLGTIQPNKKRNLTITGLTYGAPNSAESWRVFLTYKPEKYNYNAQKMTTLNVELEKNPFTLTVTGPEKATLGNDVEYKVKLENKEKLQLGKIVLTPQWSSKFYIATSSPALNDNDDWEIDTSTSTYNWDLLVKGRFTSTTEKTAKASFVLGLVLSDNQDKYELDKKETTTKLEQNNLKLGLLVNTKTSDFSLQPGNDINYSIYLKNSSVDDMKDVKVDLQIDAPSYNNRSVMDWANIVDEYDGAIVGTQISPTVRRGEIIWAKTEIPKLASMIPNNDITIDTTLGIRDIKQFDLTELKSYTIEISAVATYTDKDGNPKTLSSNPIKITVNSDLKLEVRDVKSTQDGKEQHTVKWILTNNFHNLKDISLSADVYGQAKWQLEGTEPAGKASYDSDKQTITWKIDEMPLTVDTLALPFSVTILENNPSQETLISKVKLEATDTVTKQKITLTGDEIKLK